MSPDTHAGETGDLVHFAVGEDFPEIRAAIRKICEGYPGAYWRDLEAKEAYPTDFVQALTREGFGLLSEIDLRAKFREKLGVEFREYVILGACHAPSAYKAVSLEESIGVFMPCNVIVHAVEGGTAVKAVRPSVTMGHVENPGLEPIGREVEAMLERVVRSA